MKQSPIFARVEAFMPWLLDHTAKFPKHERFRLAHHLTDAYFSLHTHLIRAALTSDTAYLTEADIALTQVRAYLRVAVEMGYTSDKQFKYAAEKLDEIGRLLGGWKRKK